jgi:RHS repeat-associated protein
VLVNRTVSEVAAPSQFPQFSSEPSDAEISRARVFEEPLIPTSGEADKVENLSLSRAISAYLHRENNDDVCAITQFLSAYPTSRWRASILLNLGIVYRWTGYFSKALESWNEAWNVLKTETQPQLKASADRALAELMELNARVGRYEILEPLLQQIQGREIRGSATEKISRAREGLWMMKNRPGESFLCGPAALTSLFAVTRAPNQRPPAALQNAQSSMNGFSLAQLQTLSDRAGMKLRMAKRHSGAPVPIPCLVNWKVGHYAALVYDDHGRYLVKDPTFAYSISITPAALDAESSGYFLIPEGALPSGWEPVNIEEGARIWGKGNSGFGDPNNDRPYDRKCKNDPCDGQQGMAHYNFHALVMSLNIVDSPVGYTPPLGSSMKFKVTYNQREANQPATFTFSNLGQKWTHDWLSYVKDRGSSASDVTVILGGGGAEVYTYDTSTQTYKVQRDSQTILTRFTSPSLYYERQYPNGSKDVYASSDGANPPNIFLTQRIDSAGNAITFHYDADLRLISVTNDALGQPPTTITYLSTNPLVPEYYLIWKVTDPFGRFAQFDYTTSSPRQLNKITDVIGITSQFGYQTGSDFINTMTTPYGTTSFATGESDYDRWLEATDQSGAVERAEFNSDSTSQIPDSDPLGVPSGIMYSNIYLSYRNTFYWDKNAMAQAAGDYTKARIWHWCHGLIPTIRTASSSIVESEKMPLENRVWYNYPGQTSASDENGVTLASPSKAAVLLSAQYGGSTQLWQYSYNSIGKVTQVSDPLPSPTPRTTTYAYDTNNIDLLSVHQGADLVASYSNYNSLHEPQTVTDAAGQNTYYSYNTNGQILTRTNAKNETTTFGYGDGSAGHPTGYLTSITSPAINNASAVTSFTYDSFNRVRTVTDVADAYTVTTDYDNLDRPTQITYPDSTTQQFQYAQNFGQGPMTILDLTKSKDRRGLWTTRHYDSNRHMDWIKDPLGRQTSFGWCGCGALSSITDPQLNTTTFNRDVQGRVYQKVFNADNTTINYLYEGQTAAQGVGATSRLASATDAKNQRTNYSYFPDDNVQQITYTDTNGQPLNPPTPSVSFTYDTNYNRVATMTDGSGQTNYMYKAPLALGAGQLDTIDGPLANDTIAFRYDELSRVTSRSVNGTANSQSWTFDSLGRLSNSTSNLGAFGYSYFGVTNRLQTLTYPLNGTTSNTANYTYLDNLHDMRLQEIWNKYGGSTTLSKFDYTYDSEGQILTWTKSYPGLTPASQRYDLTYDAADQLRLAPLKDASTNAVITSYTYQYDVASNRTSELVGTTTTTSTPNGLNEIVSQSTNGTSHSLYYDYDGNLTNDATRTFEWDAANRLTAINQIVNQVTQRSEFTYNGLNQRVKIVEKDNGNVVMVRNLVWAGSDILEWRNANNVTQRRLYPEGVQIGTSNLYYTRDHLGSIRELVDIGGNVATRYDYDPYGRRTTVSGNTNADFGFAGMYHHNRTSFNLTQYRAYSSDLGRWISRDPIGEHGGVNLYGYTLNNPSRFTDPLGLEVRAYHSPAFGIPNTSHVFFWSTTENEGIGRNGVSGMAYGDGVPSDFSPGSENYSDYTVVELPPGMTDREFLDLVKSDPNLNSGMFLPYANDCHNSLEKTAHDAGASVTDPAPRVDWLGALASLFAFLAGASDD